MPVVPAVAVMHIRLSKQDFHPHDRGVQYCHRPDKLHLVSVQHVNVQYSRHGVSVAVARPAVVFPARFLLPEIQFLLFEYFARAVDTELVWYLMCIAALRLHFLIENDVVVFVESHPFDSAESTLALSVSVSAQGCDQSAVLYQIAKLIAQVGFYLAQVCFGPVEYFPAYFQLFDNAE